ncbi:MAG: hypothetical protein ABSF61_11200 [Anaerolineales bacterium]
MTDKAALAEWVEKELAHGVGREDVIFGVCSRGSMRWPEAEQFVAEVEAVHGAEIARRQNPILLLMSAVALVAGMVWALVMIWSMADTLNRMLIEPSSPVPLGIEALAVVIVASPVAYLYLPQLVAAMALAVGGGVGILSSLETLRGR